MTHAIRTTGLLRSRDLFVHDGTKLRRIRLSAPVQILFLALAAVMLAWSGYTSKCTCGPNVRPVMPIAPTTWQAETD